MHELRFRLLSAVVFLALLFAGCTEDDPGAPVCGDGVCETGEACAVDCSDAPSGPCGDGVCSGTETCTSCAQDCGACAAVCGNGACEVGESCSSCAQDCGGCGPICGDSSCDAPETCQSCAQDCGQCTSSCGDGVCQGDESTISCPNDCACTAHTDCTEQEICIGGTCAYAYGRLYRLTIESASIAASKPSGSAWDTTAAAPDPFVEVYRDGMFGGRSTVFQDNYLPVWNEGFDVILSGNGEQIAVVMWDEDFADHDEVIVVSGTDGEWLFVVRSGLVVDFEENGTTLRLGMTPL